MPEIILTNPRAIPLADICYQDGVFIVRLLDTNTGVICLTPDTAAGVVKDVCKECLQKLRRDRDIYADYRS